jgi:hypothetical protein
VVQIKTAKAKKINHASDKTVTHFSTQSKRPVVPTTAKYPTKTIVPYKKDFILFPPFHFGCFPFNYPSIRQTTATI